MADPTVSDDEHGHGDPVESGPLGPIDVTAWGAGILGVALGLVIALCFALATSSLPG